MIANCTRSHPHELMDEACKEKSVTAQLRNQLAAKQANGGAMSHWWRSAQGGEDWPSSDEQREPRPPRIPL